MDKARRSLKYAWAEFLARSGSPLNGLKVILELDVAKVLNTISGAAPGYVPEAVVFVIYSYFWSSLLSIIELFLFFVDDGLFLSFMLLDKAACGNLIAVRWKICARPP